VEREHDNGRSARSHALAWAVSLALHAALLTAGLLLFHRLAPPQPENPERLVYVEPAPPPPPLAAGGEGETATSDAATQEEPAQQLVELAQAPQPIPTVHRSPKPTPRATRRQAVQAPTQAVPAPPGSTSSEVAGGEAGGVTGGIAGGKLGGTVGGHGDAPIAAELAASPPIVLARVLPDYPPAARLQRVEGQVLLRAVVDRTGHVEEPIVVARSVPMLDDAAVAALRQWHFTAGRDRDGRPVRVQIEVPMRFQLR
jgi:protein TonB